MIQQNQFVGKEQNLVVGGTVEARRAMSATCAFNLMDMLITSVSQAREPSAKENQSASSVASSMQHLLT
jgi:hypothetical protein